MKEQQNFLPLLKSFFKIGLTSFGGHAALVSVLQEELVKKKKAIQDELIMDGLSIASLLPGPLAVNVVAYIGYHLKGWPGALSTMFVVLLPPVTLIIGIAYLYRTYSDLQPVNSFLAGVIPVIIALILSLCYNMFRKNISANWHYLTFAAILISAFFLNSYLWIVVFIVIGGLIGYIFRDKNISGGEGGDKPQGRIGKDLYFGLVIIVFAYIILFFLLEGINHRLLFEFAKVSLTLFGGGYVMIPILHEIVVDNFQWLSSTEFANAIAFGQITPGPILVSATYVGYVTGGLLGAFLATIGIFLPSAVAMVVIGNVFDNVKGHPVVTGIMKGIRPVIIALIAYSGVILFKSTEEMALSAIITVVSFTIITFTRFNYFFLILIGGLIGLVFM